MWRTRSATVFRAVGTANRQQRSSTATSDASNSSRTRMLLLRLLLARGSGRTQWSAATLLVMPLTPRSRWGPRDGARLSLDAEPCVLLTNVIYWVYFRAAYG